MIEEMAKAFKNGFQEINIKGIGKATKLMDSGSYNWQMV